MNIKTTLTLLVILLIVVVSIAIFIPQLISSPIAVEPQDQNSTTPSKQSQKQTTSKTAVDSEVDNIINSLQAEQTIIDEDDQDANSVKTDSAIINTLGEVYNANEF